MSDDRKPVKLPAALWESIKRQQYAVREATGVEPTQGDLLFDAWNTYMAALTGPTPIAAPKSSVVPSLNRIHAQLLSVAAALENITDALGDIDGQDDTETTAAIAASDAAAANGQRVARRILRELEQPPRRAGASAGGTDATAGGAEKAAGGSQRKTNT